MSCDARRAQWGIYGRSHSNRHGQIKSHSDVACALRTIHFRLAASNHFALSRGNSWLAPAQLDITAGRSDSLRAVPAKRESSPCASWTWRGEKASAPASPPARPIPPCPAMLGAIDGGLTAKATAPATATATSKASYRRRPESRVAKRGTQVHWIPAFAGMTGEDVARLL